MTDKASPDQPTGAPDLTRFLQDWAALWREEIHALSDEPENMQREMLDAVFPGMRRRQLGEVPLAGREGQRAPNGLALGQAWRAAMTLWADALLGPAAASVASRDRAGASGAQTGSAASGALDGEVERLAGRVDELEARIAKLEATRRRRG